MSEPFLSEIKIFSFIFPPKGWALCDGQTLPINQNQALFALLGTTYGGDGRTNFNLPDLQGRVPIHMGNGFLHGQSAGEANVTLTMGQMPSHTHAANANTTAADQTTPAGNFWGNGGATAYSDTADALMNPNAITSYGGNQPHENMAPFLTLNFCIALQGIFPSRN